jgi:hypothetical protein
MNYPTFKTEVDDIQALHDKVNGLENAVGELTASHAKLIELLEAIKEHVEPTITTLSNSPIFKMLGGK